MLADDLLILIIGGIGGMVMKNVVDLAVLRTQYKTHLVYLHSEEEEQFEGEIHDNT